MPTQAECFEHLGLVLREVILPELAAERTDLTDTAFGTSGSAGRVVVAGDPAQAVEPQDRDVREAVLS